MGTLKTTAASKDLKIISGSSGAKMYRESFQTNGDSRLGGGKEEQGDVCRGTPCPAVYLSKELT